MKKCPFCAEEIQDAAIVCKHCGRDLKAGASQVQPMAPKRKIGCLTWLAVIFFGLLLIGVVERLRPAPQTPAARNAPAPAAVPQTVKLSTSVTLTSLQVTVVNTGKSIDEDWSDVTLDLNGGLIAFPFTSGFAYKLAELAHGRRVTINLVEFVKSDGTRFNPIQTKPQRVAIAAKLRNGSIGVNLFETQ